jgi:VWFA-related protein
MKKPSRKTTSGRMPKLIWPTMLAVVVTSVVLAQTPQPAQTPAPTSPDQTPTFRVGVDYVRRDVRVFDSNSHQFIPDIAQGEWQVYEDGVLQKIDSMTLVRGNQVFNNMMAPAPAVPDGFVLPKKHAADSTPGRIFVIMIDDANIEANLTPQLRQLLRDIRTTLIHDGDEFAIVSSGTSSIEINFTRDPDRFEEAAGKASGGGMTPTDIIESPTMSNGPAGIRYAAQVAFTTAYGMIDQLAKIHDRRKVFIYISSGYDFDPFPGGRAQYQSDNGEGSIFDTAATNSADGQQLTPAQQAAQQVQNNTTNPFDNAAGTNQFALQDLIEEIAELTRAATRADTSFYPIDLRGLIAGPDLKDQYVTSDDWRAYVQNTTDVLRVLASETGGIASVENNDFKGFLKRVDSVTSDYYILGYQSSNPDPIKKVRKVEIKLKRPGSYDLEYVHEYTLAPPPRKTGRGGTR